MMRSRVPRSWVERVIEIDDRDPAILGTSIIDLPIDMAINTSDSILSLIRILSVDLDPNKSLASQIGNVGKDDNNPNRPLAAQKKNMDEHDVPDINAALKELFSKCTAGMK